MQLFFKKIEQLLKIKYSPVKYGMRRIDSYCNNDIVAPIIIFLFLSIIFFWKFFFLGQVPMPTDILSWLLPIKNNIPIVNPLISDVILQIYPFKLLVFESLRTFHINFWNPYLFAGETFIANVQPGFFYPFNLLALFFSDANSFSLIVFSQLFLGGIFMYFFLRELNLNKLPSYFGSLAFIFSGPFAVWFEWGTMDSTFIYLPLAMFFILRATKKNSFKNSFFAGTALAFSSLAGHLQIFLYVFATAFLFALYENFFSNLKFGKKIFNIVSPPFLALLLGFIQIFPSLKISNDGYRESIANYKLALYYPLQHFLTLLMPNLFGNPVSNNYWGMVNYNELALYSGIITLFFLPFSLLYLKNRRIIFFGISFVISILFISGSPLYAIPYNLFTPLQKLIPLRIGYLVSFFLIILSSISLDGIFYHCSGLTKKLKLFFCLYALFIFVFFIIIIFSPKLFIDATQINTYYNFLRSNIATPLILITISFFFTLFALGTNSKYKYLISLTLIALNTINLFYFSYSYNPFLGKSNIYPNKISYINFIKKDTGLYRISTTFTKGDEAIYIKYGLQTIGGYDSLYPRQYLNFITAGSDKIIKPNALIIEGIYPEILDILNVKYVVTKENEDVNDPSLKKIFSSKQGYDVYKNTDFINRAFLVEKCLDKEPSEILNDIKNHQLDFKNTAEIEGSDMACKELNENDGTSSANHVNFIKYESDDVLIETNAIKQSFLIFTDSFQNGWRAYVDGKPNEIIKTDYNFRGIFLTPGKHSVEFKYEPFAI